MVTASVIFRLKNEARHIDAVLQALRAQTFTDYEIVVVDSGSTDGTLDIVSAHPITLVQIRPEEFTYGYGLNIGARHARGRYLVNLSGHSIPADDNWLARLIDACARPWVAASYSRLKAAPGGPLRYRFIYPVLYPRYRSLQNASSTFHNASSCVKYDLWMQCPFDERLPACEDLDWAKRVRRWGYDIVYEPKSVVYHAHDESIPRYVERTFGREIPALLKVWLRGERRSAARAKEQVSVPQDR